MDQNTSTEPTEVYYNYDDIKRKPEFLLLLLNKYVKLMLKKHQIYIGFVRAIDPISKSFILVNTSGEKLTTTVIPGHAIVGISELTPEPDIKLPECKAASPPDIVAERKTKVMAWLQQNLLPVSESGDNILLGNATLLPPYTVDDISTNNPMVVLEMRKIIEKMPQDFVPQKPIS